MNKNLKIARDYLERSTPLGKFNCGKLCDGFCCKGDKETGMWLFPHEEEFYVNHPDFTIRETDGNQGYKMVICNGECNRSERPFACRIYPFYPKFDGEKVTVIKDLRGFHSCPILKDNIKPDKKFLRNFRMATRYLLRDDETKNYILNVQKEIEDVASLLALFGSSK